MKTTRVEICILAGGLSSRMGRDKATMAFQRRTLLARIKETAENVKIPVRIIRRDIVERCGPLGGVYTALKSSRAEAVLFLACDMPFVTETLLLKLIKRFGPRTGALFTRSDAKAGFPFLLRTTLLPQVEEQLAAKCFSLNHLAENLHAGFLRPSRSQSLELFNINTPAQWVTAREMFRETGKNRSA